jgi:lysine 2,3-aminomutase
MALTHPQPPALAASTEHHGPEYNYANPQLQRLNAAGLLDSAAASALEHVATRFSVAVTPAMLDLIDPTNPQDPIGQQFVPNVLELLDSELDQADPIGDATHSPVPGIVHRYPDRLLLMPLSICPVYCRFCFRRETVGPEGSGLLSDVELNGALDYIRANTGVWEVILSGGDPLLLAPRRLAAIMKQLADIEHVRVIRIHTRIPVVDPARITDELTQRLRSKQAVYVVLHTNHPSELTQTALAACAKLIDAGIPMLSQSVLLRGINDNAATLEALLRRLVEHRIKPYYLHHADRARGTAHFRTTIATGQNLMRELRGRVSGLCQPEYMLDIPEGHGKVPIGPVWATEQENGHCVSAPDGSKHQYMETLDAPPEQP